jgi:hypothetical protein
MKFLSRGYKKFDKTQNIVKKVFHFPNHGIRSVREMKHRFYGLILIFPRPPQSGGLGAEKK